MCSIEALLTRIAKGKGFPHINAAVDLGMQVIGYDPFLKDASVLKPGVTVNNDLDQVFPLADYITVHVPLTPDTKELICAESIAKMKDTVRVMNFARGDLANADDVVEALEEGKMAAYVTDFPSAKLIDVDGVIAIPHLGASTPESEENCASMGAEELIDFLEHGNIQNSVNLPTVRMDPNGAARMTVVHKNQPNMIATITDTISKDGMNIAAFTDKNRGEIAYSIIDTDTAYSASVVADIEKNGLLMTGGGAMLDGLDKLITSRVRIRAHLAENPIEAVAIGTGKSFEYLGKLYDGFVSYTNYSSR